VVEGSAPVSSSQKCSVKPTLPISAPARSCPRTRMVSWFEVEMAELRVSWRPIFNMPPNDISHSEYHVDMRNILDLPARRRQGARQATTGFSDIEID
jgi:hypothetical protein